MVMPDVLARTDVLVTAETQLFSNYSELNLLCFERKQNVHLFKIVCKCLKIIQHKIINSNKCIRWDF